MTKLYRKIEIVSDMNNNLRLESNIVKRVSENMRVKGLYTFVLNMSAFLFFFLKENILRIK